MGELLEISRAWKKFGVHYVCEPCGMKASSLVNYYGRKKPEDIHKLRCYLQSGCISKPETMKAYSSLMFGGYY
jgi:hypothetical protein